MNDKQSDGDEHRDKRMPVPFFDLVAGALQGMSRSEKNEVAEVQRYVRKTLIGRGGLGQVWLAYDRRLEREVAVKEMRPDKIENEAGRLRFFREARIGSKLRHPAIISVLDVEDHPTEEMPFFTMPVAPGGTLQRSIADFHALPPGNARLQALRRLLQVFVTVCQAIDYAHSRGVLHRDLKPENIALGEFGEVLVLDWGLACSIRPSEGKDDDSSFDTATTMDSKLTHDGDILGTPAYMAPEQAAGAIDEVSVRSDVYSLGAVLFNILTHETPHQRHVNFQKEAKVPLTLLPAPPVRTIAPGICRGLEAICSKALATNPNSRYSSAGELGADVSRWLAGEPVTAYREPWSRRAARWAKRHRTATQILLAAGAIAIVAGVTIGASIWTTFREMLNDHVNDQALLAGQVASRLSDFAFSRRQTLAYIADKQAVRQLLALHGEGRSLPTETLKELSADLTALIGNRPYWTGLHLCDRSGRELLAFHRDEPGYGPVKATEPQATASEEFAELVRSTEANPPGHVYISPPSHLKSNANDPAKVRREQWYCSAVRSTAENSVIGIVVASVVVFSPECPLYEFIRRQPITSAQVYVADTDGCFVVQPMHHEPWHDDWLAPGLIARRFPELEDIFRTGSKLDSMSVPRSNTNQIVSAASANYDPLNPLRRFIVVVVSSYDDLKAEETDAIRGVWFPVAAVTIVVVVIAFLGGRLATRAFDA